MWIFTNIGFFSAVRHRSRPDHLMVRGRSHDDMLALVRSYGGDLGLTESDIKTSPNADYRYRVVVREIAWSAALGRMVSNIDYDNFKNSVHDRQGSDRAGVYSQVWFDMLGVQDQDEKNNLGLNIWQEEPYYGHNEVILNTPRGDMHNDEEEQHRTEPKRIDPQP